MKNSNTKKIALAAILSALGVIVLLLGSIFTMLDLTMVAIASLLVVMAVIYRPLLFSSLDEQVAQAKGVPIGVMNALFMAVLAGVITIAVPAVGTLLIFALVVTPAATATVVTTTPLRAIVASTALCLVSIWGGLVLAAMFPAPPSFVIVTLSTLFWGIAKGVEALRRRG